MIIFLKIQASVQIPLAINTIHISFLLFMVVKIVSILSRKKE